MAKRAKVEEIRQLIKDMEATAERSSFKEIRLLARQVAATAKVLEEQMVRYNLLLP